MCLVTTPPTKDVKRINKIPQTHQDVVNTFIKDAQTMLSEDDAHYNIIDAIYHIILLYYSMTIESNILTMDEQEIFRNLWIENNKPFINNGWDLIYRHSDETKQHGTTDRFDYLQNLRDKVYGRKNVMILIESSNGNVFGGYTKTGWDQSRIDYGWSQDKDAFVFQIRSSRGYDPFISNVKQDSNSLEMALGYGLGRLMQFGGRWIFDITIQNGQAAIRHSNGNNYDKFENNLPMLGGKRHDSATDIEAFQMIA